MDEETAQAKIAGPAWRMARAKALFANPFTPPEEKARARDEIVAAGRELQVIRADAVEQRCAREQWPKKFTFGDVDIYISRVVRESSYAILFRVRVERAGQRLAIDSRQRVIAPPLYVRAEDRSLRYDPIENLALVVLDQVRKAVVR